MYTSWNSPLRPATVFRLAAWLEAIVSSYVLRAATECRAHEILCGLRGSGCGALRRVVYPCRDPAERVPLRGLSGTLRSLTLLLGRSLGGLLGGLLLRPLFSLLLLGLQKRLRAGTHLRIVPEAVLQPCDHLVRIRLHLIARVLLHREYGCVLADRFVHERAEA